MDHVLETSLVPISVIRTSLEVLGQVNNDPDVSSEFAGIIQKSRHELEDSLILLQRAIREGEFLGDADLQHIQNAVINLEKHGWSGDVIDEPLFHAERYSGLPPRDFVAMLVEEVRNAAASDDAYQSSSRFDDSVYRRYVAFMFLCYSESNLK